MDVENWMKEGEKSLFVELRWPEEEAAFFTKEFDDMGIAEAAERAVAAFLGDKMSLPDEIPLAKVYWRNGASFGPFPVDISLSIEAICLRGE